MRTDLMARAGTAVVLGLATCVWLCSNPSDSQQARAQAAQKAPAAQSAQAGQNQNQNQSQNQSKQAASDPAVERARKTVRMLDTIYKNAIVLVTTHYVNEDSDLPAGVAFKKLFEAANKEGWHDVRLIDATGDPYEPENVAKTEFEKRAIKELVAGKPYVDEVVQKNGKRYLQALTAIPVVMEKCVMCHDSYRDVPAGKAIGALGYVLPIE